MPKVKNYEHNVSNMVRRAERLVRVNMRILDAAMKAGADPEQVKIDARMSLGDAPMYLHIASRMGQAIVRQAAEQTSPKGANLNIMIVGQAPSTSAWLDDVKTLSETKAIDAIPIEPSDK